jgi:hypothetical protein
MKINIGKDAPYIGHAPFLILPDTLFGLPGKVNKIPVHGGKPTFGAYGRRIRQRINLPVFYGRLVETAKFIGEFPGDKPAAAGKKLFPAKNGFADRADILFF